MPHRLLALLVPLLACAGCGGGGGSQGQAEQQPIPGIDVARLAFRWLPLPAVASTPVTLSLTLKNVGTDRAAPFKVRLDYSQATEAYSELFDIGGLEPGATATLHATYTPLLAGTLQVHVVIDPDRLLDEAIRARANDEWTESVPINPVTHSG